MILFALNVIDSELFFIFLASLAAIHFIIITFTKNFTIVGDQQKTNEEIKEIKEKVEKYPEKTWYAWDLARVKLEAYFDKNLNQINSIFWISIFVIIFGFVFIIYGITISLGDPDKVKISYIATLSGIITEFIGTTFMFLYRSTIKQANNYMKTLDWINSVGMAVQILDSIPDTNIDIKNKTKSDLVKDLLNKANSKKD